MVTLFGNNERKLLDASRAEPGVSSQFAPSQTDCVGFHTTSSLSFLFTLASRMFLAVLSARVGASFGALLLSQAAVLENAPATALSPLLLLAATIAALVSTLPPVPTGSSSMGTNIGVAALLCLWHELSLLLLCRWHEPWGFLPVLHFVHMCTFIRSSAVGTSLSEPSSRS
jgi:hypothetical protein